MKKTTVSIVLVRPIYPSNIGATARAMTNFGVNRLVIIGRQCEINSKARQAAATGQEPLRNHIEYNNWDEFYQQEGDGLKIALTAREGQQRKVKILPDIFQEIEETPEYKEQRNKHTYFIFGPEDSGLSSDDVAYCQFFCKIPIYGKNQSLNLSQATLLTLYTMRQAWGLFDKDKEDTEELSPPHLFPDNPHLFPDQTIRRWISILGFNIEEKKINAYTTFRRMLLHNVPTEKELGVFEALLQQNIRKLTQLKTYREKFGSLKPKDD